VAWVIPLSFLLTWIWFRTRGAWLATVMHGSANVGAALVFPLTDPGALFAFGAVGMTIVAAALVILSWDRFTGRRHDAAGLAVPAPLEADQSRA
jgi:membrane protease YdiL (CAAX protease family)